MIQNLSYILWLDKNIKLDIFYDIKIEKVFKIEKIKLLNL